MICHNQFAQKQIVQGCNSAPMAFASKDIAKVLLGNILQMVASSSVGHSQSTMHWSWHWHSSRLQWYTLISDVHIKHADVVKADQVALLVQQHPKTLSTCCCVRLSRRMNQEEPQVPGWRHVEQRCMSGAAEQNRSEVIRQCESKGRRWLHWCDESFAKVST